MQYAGADARMIIDAHLDRHIGRAAGLIGRAANEKSRDKNLNFDAFSQVVFAHLPIDLVFLFLEVDVLHTILDVLGGQGCQSYALWRACVAGADLEVIG